MQLSGFQAVIRVVMVTLHPRDYSLLMTVLDIVIQTVSSSTSPSPHSQRESLYLYFTETNLTQEQLEAWHQGRRCVTSERVDNNTGNVSYIFCPMTFEDPSYTECCGPLERRRCCQPQHTSDVIKMMIGLGVGLVIVVAITITVIICYCTNCQLCKQGKNKRNLKKKPYNWRTTISPVDKRLLLKTANYTVEQIWNQIVISFQNTEYFAKFGDILRRQHPTLKTRVPDRVNNNKNTSADQDLCLYLDKDLHVVIVEGREKTSWLNANFQSICKNVHVTELAADTGLSLARSRPLSPRLPTVGEEYYLEGDYSVKLTTGEIEIKFFSESLFTNFKRVLLRKYPTVSWSKYLQRDCAIIKLDNQKTVTLHLWEDICSLWFSGPGKRDWYNNEFHEIRKSATEHAIEASYTVKRLVNGYEIEFISMDYVMTLKRFIERDYPNALWEDSSLCHVIRLGASQQRPITLHLPRSGSLERKIWIYNAPYCTQWYNQDFRKLLAEAEERLQTQKDRCTLAEDYLTPVESSL